MATKNKTKTLKRVEALKHEDAARKNIPTAEFESLLEEQKRPPIRVAYERRNRDLDLQLVWRGKDEQDWSDLVVPAVMDEVFDESNRVAQIQVKKSGGATSEYLSGVSDFVVQCAKFRDRLKYRPVFSSRDPEDKGGECT